ncbi:MAG: 30S ribosomal protein S12 methylthiotransferase RimO [Phycisphaerales bacterium]|nr:MAG: 30S ribosomal protein S12 methylthiotransferase RimO [Phycisphaerales bacterium]
MTPPTAHPAADVHTVSFVSLGCPKNLVDSEKMLGLLAEDGLVPVSHDAGERADAIVVNTCGFLEASKEESLEVIRDAVRRKEAGEVKRVIVAGCLVQRHRAKMFEWAPGIDAMIGVFDRDRIVEAVRGAPAPGGTSGGASGGASGATSGGGARDSLAHASDKPRYWINANALTAARERGLPTVGLTVQGKDGKGLGYFESDAARMRLTPRHFAYLRVSEGCNQACAFCTIPSIRGKMRSKPLDRIRDEAIELIRDGAFELNLIGQDTTSYGDDIGCGLAPNAAGLGRDYRAMGGLPAMLAAINDAVAREGAAGWVRLMYAYPTNFSDEMIGAIADLPHIVKYIDIPLQHASDSVLARMRRNVTGAHQRELMEKLRERIPGVAIRTTFITGFPGETEADHEELLAFIEDVRFDALGVFEYSHEDNTPAGTMEDDPALRVPPEVKARRHDEIMRLQQEIAFDQASYLAEQFDPADPANSGVRFDVLIDGPSEAAPTPPASITDRRAGAPTHAGTGRAYFQAPQVDSVTHVLSRERLSPGELVRCTIVGSDGYDLIAVPSVELDRRASLPVIG